MFTNAKADYERQLIEKGAPVTAEALSVFYKDFLDKSYQRQMEYNREWWKINVGLLYPGMKAALRRLGKPHTGKQKVKKETGFWEKSFD
ncbi:hypothetical protein BDF14DRAFT_1737563 [Spinellus fusiger]|nr:hypothetical protein BDF14DRAFT_1737563 [Spinellus fusiger]